MQNMIVVFGALLGIALGGYLAYWMWDDGTGVGTMVTILTGAIPGTLVGAWIAFKLATYEL